MPDRSLIASDIDGYLAKHYRKDLLRFITAGSVDDGKSTLIGRMLYDAGLLYQDHLDSVREESRSSGNVGSDEIDFSLFVDGLGAEREQGITIDVAYRYFSTESRKFILADSPGHEQYTRNMITAASTANLAIILVDARRGVLDQTRRHSFLATLLGIKHIVVAVNKMDAVDYSEEVFESIRSDYSAFVSKLDVSDVHFIPVSALEGDNVVTRSDNMDWYGGSTLLNYLETVHIASDANLIDFRFPVQYVLRPSADFRGYAGTIRSGAVKPGDEVVILPSERRSTVRSIETYDGRLDKARAGQAVVLTLENEVDVSRGNVVSAINNRPSVADRFEAMLVWMTDQPMEPGRSYVLKHGATEVDAVVPQIRYRMDVNNVHRIEAESLTLNEIGRVQVSTSRPIAFDSYKRNRANGGFILIDRLSNATVAAGMILNVQATEEVDDTQVVLSELTERKGTVTPEARQGRAGHRGFALWLTGLPRSGKSSIAYELERRLFEQGKQAYVLDGTNLRLGLSADLSFGGLDRSEHLRRAAEVAKLTCDLGFITIAAFVSPYVADRLAAREIIGTDRFVEVYCSASLDVCEARDESGLYAKARAGTIRGFTGIDAPYEPPEAAGVVLETGSQTLEQNVDALVAELQTKGWL